MSPVTKVKSLAELQLIDRLAMGQVGVIRTDTLYGLVGRAADRTAVERLYSLKRRDPAKPMIVLVSAIDQLIEPLPEGLRQRCNDFWPGPNSLILPAPSAPAWLKRSGDTLAYRLIADGPLAELISQAGPLVAPSANPEGQPPARTIDEAISYFGGSVDFYVDGGKVADDSPSRLYRFLPNGEAERLR